ncbi:hypothetical protein K3217_07395 [bacterium BD-1]|nr:hypothetical protein [Ottowia caeni]
MSALDVCLAHEGKQLIHFYQRLVDHLADGTQCVVCRGELIEPLHQEQASGRSSTINVFTVTFRYLATTRV